MKYFFLTSLLLYSCISRKYLSKDNEVLLQVKNFSNDPSNPPKDKEENFAKLQNYADWDNETTEQVYRWIYINNPCHLFSRTRKKNPSNEDILYRVDAKSPYTDMSKMSGNIFVYIDVYNLDNDSQEEDLDLGRVMVLEDVNTRDLVYYTILCPDTRSPFYHLQLKKGLFYYLGFEKFSTIERIHLSSNLPNPNWTPPEPVDTSFMILEDDE